MLFVQAILCRKPWRYFCNKALRKHKVMIEAAGRLPEAQTSGLRKNALPFVETLAQSVANIAPTATPSLTIPLVFASAGNGTWLAFLLATVGLVLVSCCINQFARRSATPGSLYHYVSTGLGERTGLITGWALFLAYVTTGVVTVYGFAIFSGDLLLTLTGVSLPYGCGISSVLVWPGAVPTKTFSSRPA